MVLCLCGPIAELVFLVLQNLNLEFFLDEIMPHIGAGEPSVWMMGLQPRYDDNRLKHAIAVREQSHLFRAVILFQRSLRLLLFPHGFHPGAVPQGFEFLHIFFIGRKRRLCDVNVHSFYPRFLLL